MIDIPTKAYENMEIYAYDTYYSVVKDRLTTKNIIAEASFDGFFNSFLKYIFMSSFLPTTQLPVCLEVDEIWHEFIIQTVEYEIFCKNYLPGSRFIHHSSISKELYQSTYKVDDEKFFIDQMHWLGYHYYYFGAYLRYEIPHWKCTEFLSKTVGLSLDDINIRAKCISKDVCKEFPSIRASLL